MSRWIGAWWLIGVIFFASGSCLPAQDRGVGADFKELTAMVERIYLQPVGRDFVGTMTDDPVFLLQCIGHAMHRQAACIRTPDQRERYMAMVRSATSLKDTLGQLMGGRRIGGTRVTSESLGMALAQGLTGNLDQAFARKLNLPADRVPLLGFVQPGRGSAAAPSATAQPPGAQIPGRAAGSPLPVHGGGASARPGSPFTSEAAPWVRLRESAGGMDDALEESHEMEILGHRPLDTDKWELDTERLNPAIFVGTYEVECVTDFWPWGNSDRKRTVVHDKGQIRIEDAGNGALRMVPLSRLSIALPDNARRDLPVILLNDLEEEGRGNGRYSLSNSRALVLRFPDNQGGYIQQNRVEFHMHLSAEKSLDIIRVRFHSDSFIYDQETRGLSAPKHSLHCRITGIRRIPVLKKKE